MYLKSLEIHGFKSFANKLVLEFHNGITAIVGPNGSGKSNVADAVRWVLGEQSAKQLRGARMEDVIFAGTQARKPLGFAYVAITITNEDKKLDVPYGEVKIARRVYRSGESEYLLNGTPCRLRDVQELLFDTGIGKEGYSIIGQGQIDKILSGRPEERRELFDEAAGIVKYKKRKAAAEKNLEEEKQNLVRIEDVLSELSRQVAPLEKQAAKAKEYFKYRDRLKILDVNMFLMEYDRTKSGLEEIRQKKAVAGNDLSTAQKEAEENRLLYARLEEQLDSLNNNIEADTESLSVKKVQANDSENKIKVLNEQVNTIRQDSRHYMEQTENLNARREALRSELKDYSNQDTENEEKLGKLYAAKSENEEKLREISEKTSARQKEIEECRNSIMAVINGISDIKAEENRLKTLLEQNNIKKAEFAQRILRNQSDASLFSETLEYERKILADVLEKIGGIKAAGQKLAAQSAKLEEESAGLGNMYRDVQQKYHMENSRLASLKNMAERYDGFGQSIRRVMEQKESHKGIIGVVADVIKVNKEYETAIETALGGSIQNIVTDNAQTAKEMIQFLKKNKFGRATFLPLSEVKAGQGFDAQDILKQKGVLGIASSLVETGEEFRKLVNYLLGRFVVADNIDNAIALAGKYHHRLRIVTIEGELLNPGGSMSGGAFKNSNNLLGRRREMENLERVTEELAGKLSGLSARIKKIEEDKKNILEKAADNEKQMQELVLQQNTAKINYDRAYSDLQSNEDMLNTIKLEAGETETKAAEIRKALEQTSIELSGNEEKNKSYEEAVNKMTADLRDLNETRDTVSRENSGVLLGITSLEGTKSFISENVNRISQELEDIERGLEEAALKNSSADRLILEKQQEIGNIAEGIEKTRLEIKELSDGLVKKKETRVGISARHKKCLDEREELSALINGLDKECFRLNNKISQMDDSINSYTDYMWEQYGLTYHSALELKTDNGLDFQDIKKQAEEVKSSIKALGDINVNAVEQYNELMERYELLTSQHADLTEASEVLVGVIEELDTEMRRQFEVQFAEIGKRFDNVFKELFGGGRGSLELVEGEDVLLAGINIIAQPPGKKLQNMMQLSGGEKALSAIALLFAIQSLKPSPFCLLDEIEAALDDSNVGRYAQYLHKLSDDTQFIVITHRRGTMNEADILYGITMQEKGVSALVSVNLEEGSRL